MFYPIRFVILCLLSLCLAVSVQAQDEPKIISSLNDAKTVADVLTYTDHEYDRLTSSVPALDPKEEAIALADMNMQASEKILELAKTPDEKEQAYWAKYSAFVYLVQAEIDETEQKIEAFFKELDTKPKTEQRTAMLYAGRFFLFSQKAKKQEATPENFDKFKSELKGWLDGQYGYYAAQLGFEVAYRNNVPAEQFAKELIEYSQSPQYALRTDRNTLRDLLEKAIRLAVGTDPKLYGKTLDDKDFDWEKFRGKNVLIQFTATWCGPCKEEIPGMLEAYKKYKDKGLEIVSVYIAQHGDDPVAAVKKAVDEEKLPWIILSEALTKQAGQPEYEEFYGFDGVPTMVLTDKEGKIIMSMARGNALKTKLAEIFK